MAFWLINRLLIKGAVAISIIKNALSFLFYAKLYSFYCFIGSVRSIFWKTWYHCWKNSNNSYCESNPLIFERPSNVLRNSKLAYSYGSSWILSNINLKMIFNSSIIYRYWFPIILIMLSQTLLADIYVDWQLCSRKILLRKRMISMVKEWS